MPKRLCLVFAYSITFALLGSRTSIGKPTFNVPAEVQNIFAEKCLDCHTGDSPEGDLRLDNLATLSIDQRLDVLNKAQDQLFFQLMPPNDSDQPSESQRAVLGHWLRSTLRRHNASKLDQKLKYPAYGNLVDHQKLFSGEITEKPFTPARQWLVSPQIFHERVNEVFGLEGRARQKSFYGVTNPFVLPETSGVRDYDITALDGGHLLVMMGNAQWISQKQIFAAVHSGENRRNIEFPNPKDRWLPPASPPSFVAIVRNDSVPTETEMLAAIEAQFQSVLQRSPHESEQRRYLDLMRSTIGLGGNTEGLRQMLVGVLLESEFLYRQEMGEGQLDQHGRRLLSPHESARAIAYALGDKGPDQTLRDAAKQGRLQTKGDFTREVERLLADQERFRGPIDPSLTGKNMRSHETSHPKLVRFFREFFGYTGATRIFKDIKRSNGFYQNPSRGTAGTPGFLIKEADRIVDLAIQNDQDVFANLLTTDQYFVYHDKDNATGAKIIAEWTDAYEKLRDTDWKTDPEQVIEENLEYIKSKKSLRIIGGKQKREFMRHMYFWGETIGKGRTPFTTVSFAHGYTYNHSTFYNLPETPHIFRYGGVENKNFKGLDDVEFWDYPVKQPFKIPNRMGILTHPAWLIAHSSNFHTDPIKRGRWIREKLLAGSVPDVPITVDAQIPDDPHQTLRQRVESVTMKDKCWKCHQRMNPLGMPLEVFDDFGRFRRDEPLEYPENLIGMATKKNGADEYKTSLVSTLGELRGTGDPSLDGKVDDPFEMIDRLARSQRVRQSFIRHAFRFFLGRNELLSDSATLIAADQAYVQSGGSFRSVVVSLLTSESFMYRKPIE